jgi:hypothetical protein
VAALRALLKRVRQQCRSLDNLDQWYELTADVGRVFQEWEDVLPQPARQRLEQVLERAGQVQERVDLACRSLQQGLHETITVASVSPTGFPLKGVLIGAATTAAVGAGIVAVMVVPSIIEDVVSVRIHNQCPEPLVYTGMGIAVSGTTVPAFGSQTVRVPGLEVDVQRGPQAIAVSAFGLEMSFQVATEVGVSFDDEPIQPGFQGGFDLGESEEHDLLIRCP